MKEAAAHMIETPTAVVALALVIGIGMGLGFTVVMETKNFLFPYKPTPDLCKAFGYVKGE